MKVRKLVYVSGPLSNGGELDIPAQRTHMETAIEASQHLIDAGYAPLNPHLTLVHDEYLFDTGRPGNNHQTWMAVDKPMVLASDAILRLPGDSVGADRETRWANQEGIPVFKSIYDLFDCLPA